METQGSAVVSGSGSEQDDLPIASALRTVSTEFAGLQALQTALTNGLGGPFRTAVDLILNLKGRVIVTGIGKSGHIGVKLAATLASTGTPAFFVHASEASHGDLGMVTPDDAVIAISWSGETQELASIIAYTRRFKVPLIALTSRRESSLGSAADLVLELPRVTEACPHGLAPTASTIIQMSLGDALAIALLESRGFTAQDFGVFHPGGKLGASLKHARDIMHRNDMMPLAGEDTAMGDAIVLMTQKGFGVLGILDTAGELVGIITDGDLRRHLRSNLLDMKTTDVMTKAPRTIGPDMLLASAVEFINAASITAVFVVEDRKPVGIIHLHDLLRSGAA
ncbi:KpsF/GutQ family sugar-phosphate isomerase [Stappia sp. F7233]|uniref:KpsF/GutQ family sugar-phosphate isomerase n=1 Tax=Stappia albiluteola TaxID=2758565 RepID=A0A839AEG3_9HYPH|nr:KpsF/GutQ family sugar-phosphate isomerase [Stappia albiluteola]MBA5777344.1 KpsF/GutQ family sugar-phosphate isomerase [Stappia albiluteola]